MKPSALLHHLSPSRFLHHSDHHGQYRQWDWQVRVLCDGQTEWNCHHGNSAKAARQSRRDGGDDLWRTVWEFKPPRLLSPVESWVACSYFFNCHVGEPTSRASGLSESELSSPILSWRSYLFPRFPGTSVFSARSSGPGSSRLRSLLVVFSLLSEMKLHMLRWHLLVAGDSSRRGMVQLPRQIHIPPRLLHYFSLERPSMLIGSGSCNAKSFGGSSDFHHHDSSHFHNKWRYRLYSYCSVNTYYWNPVDLMSSSCVNFATFLVSTERKCHICDIIVLNKSTLTQSQRISDLLYSRQQPDIDCLFR